MLNLSDPGANGPHALPANVQLKRNMSNISAGDFAPLMETTLGPTLIALSCFMIVTAGSSSRACPRRRPVRL